MAFNRQLFVAKRCEQRYSQRQLAQAAGVASAWIASIETGKSKNPGYSKVKRCADILGISDARVFFEDIAGNFQQEAQGA